MGGGEPEAIVDVVDGVASLQIPEEIFDEAELLWKSYVVGYFIGDAPHVGSIHATVNRIWSAPKAGTKIDVQFIEKNTVLFRIENSQMRSRVIQRKYWHIADIPLVVNVWTPESALHPPDLSAMPLWIDLKGVPNNLYSHKGLKCLSKAVGQFVKLHPSTEKCVRLDVARALVEVNLHQPLVEKISFKDNAGFAHEVEVNFPWLPPRCSVCRRWGHKGQDCSSKEIRILNNKVEETAASLFAVIPHGGDKAGDRVEEVEGNEVVTVEEDVSKEGNVFENLIQDLEALTPVANNVAALEGIKLTEPTTEVFHTNGVGAWENGRGMKQVGDTGGEGAIIISPSRFSPLQGIVEEEEDAMEENGKEVEEGEILETNRVWDTSAALYPSRTALSLFHRKLKLLKQPLRELNKTHYGNLPARTKQAYNELCECQNRVLQDPSPDNVARAAEAAERWNVLARIEEKFYRQKSCVRWLTAGDQNTTFFHNMVQMRIAKNTIRSLVTAQGEVLTTL
ncbi:hypothetical protein BRARA_G00721 [Brassica rapa]|uniref:DUF4283 domain-containing protein n=1 Tax=Brassica campestris TaxID=3711 RepID=A0A397YKK7_BRACM|nr:hypothetical protein BRARA_G00721 [Brassica rapa]